VSHLPRAGAAFQEQFHSSSTSTSSSRRLVTTKCFYWLSWSAPVWTASSLLSSTPSSIATSSIVRVIPTRSAVPRQGPAAVLDLVDRPQVVLGRAGRPGPTPTAASGTPCAGRRCSGPPPSGVRPSRCSWPTTPWSCTTCPTRGLDPLLQQREAGALLEELVRLGPDLLQQRELHPVQEPAERVGRGQGGPFLDGAVGVHGRCRILSGCS
jgi:hypothetical protein